MMSFAMKLSSNVTTDSLAFSVARSTPAMPAQIAPATAPATAMASQLNGPGTCAPMATPTPVAATAPMMI